MRILFIFLPFTALIKTGSGDVIFTKELCSRETYGLQVQLGDPSRYRQCGPNGRVWIVPCVPGAVFDPLNKMCKEQPKPAFPSTLPQVRRKSGKSDEDRKWPDPELKPISEEFIFSTKRPMRPRPRNKSPAPSTFSTTTEVSTTRLLGSEDEFPTPSVLTTFRTSTNKPYSPAFTPPNRKPSSTGSTRRPKVGLTKVATTGTSATTPTQISTEVVGPVPASEAQLTNAYQSTFRYTTSPQMHTVGTTVAPHVEHTINYKGITMSEDEFLKQLLRIVQAHQLAINKIEQEVQEEQRNSGRQVGASNYTEDRNRLEIDELERQRQLQIARELQERQQREKEEFEWQQRIAMQQAEIQRQEEQMRRQLEEVEEQRRQKVLAWQREVARQKAEYEKKQRELERERQEMERRRQEEEAEREAELQRQRDKLRQAAEKKKKEEARRNEIARKKAEAEQKEKERQEEAARQEAEEQRQEEQRKEQEKARQLAEKQRKERERKEEIARQKAEKQKRERERQQELARLKAERLRREKEQREKIRKQKMEKERQRKEEERKLEQERLRKEEEQRQEQESQRKEEQERLEAERRIEEERREQERLAVQEEMNRSAVTKPGFRIYPEQSTEDGNTDTSGYHSNNDFAKTIMAGLMTVRQSTEAPDVEIIHFTAPPPTPFSPATEWVTSPHSWRPPPDVQTNTLEWTQLPQIPSTGTSELPSMVTSKCNSVEDCDFSYETDLLCPHYSDPNRYLQCTPMIGRRGQWAERMCPPHLVFMPYYGRCGLSVEAALKSYPNQKVIPRLPSEPEVVHWKGNKELPRIVTQPQNPQVATFAPVQQTTTEKPIFKIIEEFPPDLLSPFTYIDNAIPTEYYELDENASIDPSVSAPLFPLVQPHFLMPFGKFRDAFKNKEQSFMGSVIKPAIKKIAMDQTETFLDRILSDQIPTEKLAENRTGERSVSPQRSEDGWRKFA